MDARLPRAWLSCFASREQTSLAWQFTSAVGWLLEGRPQSTPYRTVNHPGLDESEILAIKILQEQFIKWLCLGLPATTTQRWRLKLWASPFDTNSKGGTWPQGNCSVTGWSSLHVRDGWGHSSVVQSLSSLLNQKNTEQKKQQLYSFFYSKYLLNSQTGAIYLPENFYVIVLARVLLIKEAENENILFQQN